MPRNPNWGQGCYLMPRNWNLGQGCHFMSRNSNLGQGCHFMPRIWNWDQGCYFMQRNSNCDNSDWPTVCLGEIAISLSPLVLFLSIQTDPQCVSVKLPSPYHHWFSCYPFRLIYRVSRRNCHLSITTGSLPMHSNWSTVCLGEIAFSLSPLVPLLSIQTDLQCVLVKLPSPYHHWFSCYPFRLIYRVSRWNCHLSITTGSFAIHSDWSTVCLGEIAFSLSPLVLFLPIDTDLQCVSVKSPFLYHHWFSFYPFRLIYSVSQFNGHLSITTGSLSFHPFTPIYSVSRWNHHLVFPSRSLSIYLDWSTVCFGEITTSLSPLGPFLSIHTDLQCVSVNLSYLYHHWFPCYPFRLIYSVSWWNRHLSITTGSLAIHSDWSTVCPGEVVFSLSSLVPLLSTQTGLQCVSVKFIFFYRLSR